MYKVCEDTFYVFNPRFDGFLHIFFDVEDYGKESKVHCDLVFPEVAKTVDGDEAGLLVTCKPDEVNVPEQQFLYPTAGVDIVHVGIEDDLEHHLRMIGNAAALFVKLTKIIDIQTVNNGIDNANGIIFRNVLIDSLRKKPRLVAYVRAKV